MSDPRGVVVTGIGAVTPVGATVVQTASSVRAGLNRFTEFDDFDPENEEFDLGEPEPLQGARVAGIGLDDVRIPALLTRALQDLARQAPLLRTQLAATALHVALPEPVRPGESMPPDALHAFLARTAQGMLGRIVLHPRGRCAGLIALDAAATDLTQGGAQLCIVVGADSYHPIDTLEWLDEEGRLKSKRNRDGFIPGEGAGAVLLEPEALARGRGVTPLARIDGFAASPPNESAADGGLLARTLERVLGAGRFEWAACDLNGESARAREWGICQVRLGARTRDLRALWHPADCWGEVGAATGTLLAALVARAFARGYAPAERCLVWTASDDGTRAAMAFRGPA